MKAFLRGASGAQEAELPPCGDRPSPPEPAPDTSSRGRRCLWLAQDRLPLRSGAALIVTPDCRAVASSNGLCRLHGSTTVRRRSGRPSASASGRRPCSSAPAAPWGPGQDPRLPSTRAHAQRLAVMPPYVLLVHGPARVVALCQATGPHAAGTVGLLELGCQLMATVWVSDCLSQRLGQLCRGSGPPPAASTGRAPPRSERSRWSALTPRCAPCFVQM